MWITQFPTPFLFFLYFHPSWLALQSYRPHFEERDGHTALSDGLLAGVFLSCKVNARRSVHSSQYQPTDIIDITLRENDHWSLARNLDCRWWHHHTSLKLFACSPWLCGHISVSHKLCVFWEQYCFIGTFRQKKKQRRISICKILPNKHKFFTIGWYLAYSSNVFQKVFKNYSQYTIFSLYITPENIILNQLIPKVKY